MALAPVGSLRSRQGKARFPEPLMQLSRSSPVQVLNQPREMCTVGCPPGAATGDFNQG
jgi:hypothetical protein